MATKSIRRFFQKILDGKILGQIESLIAKAQNLGLPEKDLNEALINLEYYEYELAFDVIVEQVYEFDIKIDQEFYDLALEICETMKLDKAKYQFLKELV